MPRKPIKFDLDFTKKDIFSRFTVKQFDDVIFTITPKLNNEPYDITGMTGIIYVGVNNEMFKQDTNITVSSNSIVVTLDKNMLSKDGRSYAEIELTDSTGTVTSSSFIFDIDRKIGEGATIPGAIEGFVEKYAKLTEEFKKQFQTYTNDLDTRFNTLTASQQQDAEVIDARKGETSLRVKMDKIDEQFISITQDFNLQLEDIEQEKANKNDVAKISNGTPLFASSTGGMTDTTKNYVNTSDGYLYIYNNGSWFKTNVQYQSTGIEDNSITKSKLDEPLQQNLTLDAKNLAPNSDFSNGTTNWTRTDSSATVSIENNTLTLTGSGTNTSVYVYGSIPSKIVGHEYYYRVEIKADGEPVRFRLYCGADIAYLDNPNQENFHTISGIGQYQSSNLFVIYAQYSNPSIANGKKINIRNIHIIDLTEMFGENIRPSLEEIDYIFSKHEVLAFNGIKNILSSKKTMLNQAKQEIELKNFFGNSVITETECVSYDGMSVQVRAGKVYNNGTVYNVPSTVLSVPQADSAYERTDLIFIDNSGTPRLRKGKALQWVEVPALPDDGLAIAEVRVPPNSTSIIGANIIDRRIFSNPSKIATVMVAASNSSPQDKADADYVCDGVNDEVEIQRAVDRFVRNSGKVILANGDYYIDNLFDSGHAYTGKFGIVVKRPDIQREIRIEGITAPLRKLGSSNDLGNAPIIRVRKTLYDSLATDELVTIIGVLPTNIATGEIAYPSISLVTNNIGIVIPDNKKNTRMIDSYYASMYKCDGFIGMYQVFEEHNQKAEGIRGLRGMNFGTGYEISNCFVYGAGIAYNISGEHLIMKNCGVRFSLYPFAFGLTPEQERNAHPITLINCCHEACVNSMIFGSNPNKQTITIIDHNLEHSLQVQDAIELQPGAFCGSIEYALVGYPGAHDYINVDYRFWEDGHGINFRTRNIAHKESGTTLERPNFPNRNQSYFDTDINKMIIYINGQWVDMMGIMV